MLKCPKSQHSDSSEYLVQLKNTLTKVHNLAQETLLSVQQRQKRDYDLRLKVHTYQVGDLVYKLDSVKKIGFSPKLQQVWKGPYIVSCVLSPVLFKVMDRKKTRVIHHDRLKPCNDRDIPLWVQRRRNDLLRGEQEETTLSDLADEPEESLDLEWLYPEPSPRNDGYESACESSEELVKHDVPPPPMPIVDEPPITTRTGRQTRRPKHLSDYYTDV